MDTAPDTPITASALAALRQDYASADAERRRLRHLIALQRQAIGALEEAIRFYQYSPDDEPGRGALAYLERCREDARRAQQRV